MALARAEEVAWRIGSDAAGTCTSSNTWWFRKLVVVALASARARTHVVKKCESWFSSLGGAYKRECFLGMGGGGGRVNKGYGPKSAQGWVCM